MASMFSKISVYLWFGATVFFYVLSAIFYNKKCGKFFQKAGSLSFGLGIVFFCLSGLFLRGTMWVIAGFCLVVGLILFGHSKSS